MKDIPIKTILVVEDDLAIRGDLATFLSSEGFEVLTAENGEVALRILDQCAVPPSVVLLDIMMPVMDGWKFRETQVLNERHASIPVVVMTADGHAPEKAAKMKANGYVKKPIDLDELVAAISACAV